PNADGMNDNFVMEIQCATLLKTVAVDIVNRWGQALHHADFDVQKLSTSKNSLQLSLWNGTTNSGAKVPEGTYFYVIEYTKVSGEKESLKGSVSLLR
ncbi:MAG: gliding motility-associated C-terminal domain-containing protein, partial [Flavobacteriales bacterium]|nr:gliding motility-associated C-terminal domain-containing protein [Flavobacteriales bacterium]